MGRYFGTDGFRAEANVGLRAEHALQIGRFIGHYFGQGKKCKAVIGKDTRLSSYMLEDALAAGLTASGADAYLLHVTTTPSVSYVTRTEDFDCGLMISASHNPYYDNGIKLINSAGEKMEDAVIERLEDFLDGRIEDLPYARREDIGKTVDYFAGRNRYIGYLISLARHSFKGIRVGLDCANGSTWMIAKSVFDALGAKTFVINDTPDGLNINKDCGSTSMAQLQALVRDHSLNVGFAYDGDADRCLAVDERGNVVDGDRILYLYARHMKDRGKLKNNLVVTTIMSGIGLYKALDEADIAYETTPVGDRHVYESMRRNGALLGGEPSGHTLFAKYANTADGILSSLKVMQAMLDREIPLSKLVEPVKSYPRTLRNIAVADQDLALLDTDVKTAVNSVQRRLGRGEGRLLFRKSGTEPVLRLLVEGPTQELCDECADSVVAVLGEKGHLAGGERAC